MAGADEGPRGRKPALAETTRGDAAGRGTVEQGGRAVLKDRLRHPILKEESSRRSFSGGHRYIAKRIPGAGRSSLSLRPPGTSAPSINRELFEWVIENLMKNALDAMEGPTGRIAFTIQQQGKRTTIDVNRFGQGN